MNKTDFPALQIEKVDLATFGKGAKVVAIAAPTHGEGVSTVTKQLAKRSADVGKRTLVLCFSNNFNLEDLPYTPWRIGTAPGQSLIKHPDGFFFLHIYAPDEDIFKWADTETPGKFYAAMKKSFDKVIVDLPPIFERDPKEVSPIPLAAAADCLMLVTLSGSLNSVTAKNVIANLEQADISLSGILLNDRDYPTIGAELARQADKLRKYAPDFMDKLADKARKSEFLNVHI